MTDATHVPVLRDRVVALVAPPLERPGSVLVDATLGLGRHAEAVLRACPQAHLVGLDRDPDAIEYAEGRLQEFASRVTLVHALSDELPDVLMRAPAHRASAVTLFHRLYETLAPKAQRHFDAVTIAP